MADNLTLNSGSGGATLATDDVGGVHFPVGKVAYGDGTSTLITTTTGLPVQPQTSSTWAVVGGAAHDAVVAGNPVLAAAFASASAPTDVSADGDVVRLWADRAGRLQVGDGGGTLSIDDGAGSITVDGTVAVSGTVTVGSHAVTNAGTFAVQESGAALTALQLIDNLVLVEDAAHVSGDPGVQVLAVRRDAAAVSGGTDGDYSTLNVDGSGRLWCNVSNTVTVTGAGGTFPVTDSGGSLTVDNGGTFAVQATVAAGATTIGKAEDAASADADVGVPAMAVRKATPANTSGADGDYEMLQMSAGRLWASATIDAALPAGTNNIGDVDILSIAAGDNNIGNVDIVTMPNVTLAAGTNTNEVVGDAAHDAAAAGNPLLMGAYASAAAPTDVSADADAVRLWALRSGALAQQPTFAGVLAVAGNGASGTGVQRVTLANDSTGVLATVSTVTSLSQFAGNAISTNNGAAGAGVLRVTVANDSTGILAGVTTVSTLTTLANGQTAHDSATTGSPLRVGAKAETALSGVTLVADGDATDLYAGVDGVLIVRPHCNLEDVVQERTTNTDGASTAFASGLAAPGAGIRLWVKNVTVCNSSATFCTVDLRDGSGGSVLWTLPVPATGGVTHNFDPPLKLTANTALAFDASAATTTLTISANGFKSKV